MKALGEQLAGGRGGGEGEEEEREGARGKKEGRGVVVLAVVPSATCLPSSPHPSPGRTSAQLQFMRIACCSGPYHWPSFLRGSTNARHAAIASTSLGGPGFVQPGPRVECPSHPPHRPLIPTSSVIAESQRPSFGRDLGHGRSRRREKRVPFAASARHGPRPLAMMPATRMGTAVRTDSFATSRSRGCRCVGVSQPASRAPKSYRFGMTELPHMRGRSRGGGYYS
jgi:hypothetical protein